MKKFIGVFGVLAMLFCFASCSGDMHDDGEGWIAQGFLGNWSSGYRIVDGKLDFETDSNQTSTSSFAIMSVNGDWVTAIRGEKLVSIGTLPDSYTDKEKEDALNFDGDGNIILSGLKPSTKYTLLVDLRYEDAFYVTLSLVENGPAAIPPIEDDDTDVDDTGKVLYLVGADPIGWDEKNEEYRMEKDDNVYTITVNRLPNAWKIWDGTWDYSFGKGEVDPMVGGEAVDAWFAGMSGDFGTTSDSSVKIILTVVEGSDENNSSIPASLRIESVN